MDSVKKYQLMFDQPSLRFDEGLPIGNDRLGGVVTGGLPEKGIYLNEETVWYGGPRERNNPDALAHLGKIRELMRGTCLRSPASLHPGIDGSAVETQRHYSTPAMLVMDYCSHDGKVEYYKRVLDFETAMVTETYRLDGVAAYELTSFARSPDAVIAIRVRTSQPVLEFSVNLERGEQVGNFSYGTHMDETVRSGSNGLVMRGNCGGEKGLRFLGVLFGTSNGKNMIIGDKLVFHNSSKVVLFVAAKILPFLGEK